MKRIVCFVLCISFISGFPCHTTLWTTRLLCVVVIFKKNLTQP